MTGDTIPLARGLTQGDLLSPLPFLLVMDALHNIMVVAAQRGVLTPIGRRTTPMRMSLYADDVVVFSAQPAKNPRW